MGSRGPELPRYGTSAGEPRGDGQESVSPLHCAFFGQLKSNNEGALALARLGPPLQKDPLAFGWDNLVVIGNYYQIVPHIGKLQLILTDPVFARVLGSRGPELL